MPHRAEIEYLLSKQETRKELCQYDLLTFWAFYFAESFECSIADFHRLWASALMSDSHICFKAFRESLKTTLAKIYVIHSIAYRTRRFITWYGFEQSSAKSNIYDIVVQLQTNERIRHDFGSLFPSSQKQGEKEKFSVGEFITKNKVKVKALSLGTG